MATELRKGWWSVDIPGYRDGYGTYTLFPYEELPPIQETLDEEWGWLAGRPAYRGAIAEYDYSPHKKPDVVIVTTMEQQVGRQLPAAFVHFMGSPELQRRVRSCTDAYLEMADRPVRTVGANRGYLIHFLSDSQWVLHWYLFVGENGEHFVVVSPFAYGFEMEEGAEESGMYGRAGEVDMAQEEMWFCAPTFVEFVYRFWIENELWYALDYERRPLTAEQQAYVDHYGRLKDGGES